MADRTELESRLRRQAEVLDEEVGARPGLEERILHRAVSTPPMAPRRMPLLREAAIAAGVFLLAAAAGFGVIQLRAARQVVADHPPPPVNGSTTASGSPPPKVGPRLSYTPGIKVPPGPIQIGSVYTDTSLRMFTSLRGWAVGPAGKGNTGDHDALLLTVDGGNHWRNVTPPGSAGWTDRTNFFLDLGHAWVATTPHVVQHPTQSATITVYRTSDGANSWQASSFQVKDGSPSQLDFVDPLHGWLMLQIDQGDALYRTSDGGVSWELASESHAVMAGQSPPAGTLPLIRSAGIDFSSSACEFDPFSAVAFSDPSTGWAGGWCNGPTLTTYFYVTHDAGITWHRVALPAIPNPPACPCGAASAHPDFTSPSNGTFTVDVEKMESKCETQNGSTGCSSNSVPNKVVMYATSNGGDSWRLSELPGVAAFRGNPAFVGGRKGWFSAVGLKAGGLPGEIAPGKLYVTGDGGASWTPLSAAAFPGGPLNFIGASEGWTLPSESDLPLTILHTSDGGQSWEKLFPYVNP